MSFVETDIDKGPRQGFYLGDADDAPYVPTFYPWESCADIERESPRLQWLVEGLIPLWGIIFLWGMSGTLKSFIAQSVAGAVARGTDWLGRAVRQGPVLFIAAEGGQGLGVRLRGYRQDAGLAEPLPENWRWMREPVRLANEYAVTALLRDIEATRRAFGDPGATVLVIADTLGANLAGDADENVPRDMQRVLEGLRRITAANATVIVVHHSDKGGTRDRGHGSLRNRADVMIKAQGNGKRVTLTFDKRRDGGQTGEKLVLDAEPVMLPDGESTLVLRLAKEHSAAAGSTSPRPSGTGGVKTKGNRLKLLQALEGLGQTGARSGEWQHASGLADGTYNRLRRALTGKEVEKRGNRYILARFLATDPPPDGARTATSSPLSLERGGDGSGSGAAMCGRGGADAIESTQ